MKPVLRQWFPLIPAVFVQAAAHGNWYEGEDDTLWYAHGNETPQLVWSWRTGENNISQFIR